MALFPKVVQLEEPNKDVMNIAPKKQFDGVFEDIEKVPLNHLLTHIPGARMIVDWYEPLYTSDSETRAHNVSANPTNQQYKLIKNVELKVTTPIPKDPAYDPEKDEFDVEGEATTYPGITPNFGAMFLMAIPGGNVGVFYVKKSPERKTIFKEAVYTFTFGLKGFLKDEEYKSLSNKVVEKYFFERDNLDTGMEPVVHYKDYEYYKELKELRTIIPEMYFRKFYDKRYNSLVVPQIQFNKGDVFDPYLNRFVDMFFSPIEGEFIKPLQHVYANPLDYKEKFTIFDLIHKPSKWAWRELVKEVVIKDTKHFKHHAFFGGIYYTGFKGIVQPYDSQDSSVCETMGDKYYLFGENFYNQVREGLLEIEELVLDHIEKGMVNPDRWLKELEATYDLPLRKQFYQFPILYALIPSVLKGI